MLLLLFSPLCVVSASTDPPQTAACLSDSRALTLPMRWLYGANVSKYCVVPGSDMEAQQQFFLFNISTTVSDVYCSEQSLWESDAFCSIQRNVWVICLNNGAESQMPGIFCAFGEKSVYSPVCSCCLKPRQMAILYFRMIGLPLCNVCPASMRLRIIWSCLESRVHMGWPFTQSNHQWPESERNVHFLTEGDTLRYHAS